VPPRCLHEIEFFSDLVSNAIAIIGQVKEIARHGLRQRRCRTPRLRLLDGPGLATTCRAASHDQNDLTGDRPFKK
jgi:hypothetical protein